MFLKKGWINAVIFKNPLKFNLNCQATVID